MTSHEQQTAELARISYWIRAYAHERGLSLNAVIERAGLSVSTAYTALRGSSNPTLATLTAFANALDVRLFQLLMPTPEELRR